PCPAFTVAPGGGATTTTAAATTAATTAAPSAASDSSGGVKAMLPWLVPAILGALLWLALTLYFCSRYCRNPCPHRPGPRPKKVQVAPKPKAPEPVKSPPRLPPPPPPPKPRTPLPPPPPPPPPEPIPPPYLMGFWKETYTDQDHVTKNPDRAARPKPVESMPEGEGNAPPPDHLKLGQPGGSEAIPSFLPGRKEPQLLPDKAPSPAAPPPKKKSFCSIL
ncbi:hypothetical protein EGW08_019365, partial [Elysia chlorotica]